MRYRVARFPFAVAALAFAFGVASPLARAIAQPAQAGVADRACPAGAIQVRPGEPIQEAVDRAGPRATICLKNGVHRLQAVTPLQGQRFHGEGRTIINGARIVTGFVRDGAHWVAGGQPPPGPAHGECRKENPACGVRVGVFLDDRPLHKTADLESLKSGGFFLDVRSGRIYLADDPKGRKVEASVAKSAFSGTAGNVAIRNIVVEKYANPAQYGAIYAQDGNGWVIENVEARLNNGVGVRLGEAGQLRRSNLHNNGQIGAIARGRNLVIEDNRIWDNNIHGFDQEWEAGGMKVVVSDGVVFRRNHVHDNGGPGLWCDIDCRNVIYEENTVENNLSAGIFHEISFDAVIRNNRLSGNGHGKRVWFWGTEILIAASENVQVHGNTLTVPEGGCGIMLIDQNRTDDGRLYKTRGNRIHDNTMIFAASACAGGTSDARPDQPNFRIITSGGNLFDTNTYSVGRGAAPPRFVWGQDTVDWAGFLRLGLEANGKLTVRP